MERATPNSSAMESLTASLEYRADAAAFAAGEFDADELVRAPISGGCPQTSQPERAVVERLAGRSVSLPIVRPSMTLPAWQ